MSWGRGVGVCVCGGGGGVCRRQLGSAPREYCSSGPNVWRLLVTAGDRMVSAGDRLWTMVISVVPSIPWGGLLWTGSIQLQTRGGSAVPGVHVSCDVMLNSGHCAPLGLMHHASGSVCTIFTSSR